MDVRGWVRPLTRTVGRPYRPRGILAHKSLPEQLRGHGIRYRIGDRAIERRHVALGRLEAAGPDVSFIRRANQVRRDAQAAGDLLHLAEDDVLGVELRADRGDIAERADLTEDRRIANHGEARRVAGEAGDDRIGQRLRELIVVLALRVVVEER